MEGALKKFKVDKTKNLSYLEVYPLLRRLILKLAGLTNKEVEAYENKWDRKDKKPKKDEKYTPVYVKPKTFKE